LSDLFYEQRSNKLIEAANKSAATDQSASFKDDKKSLLINKEEEIFKSILADIEPL
jgi:hypothetical protein